VSDPGGPWREGDRHRLIPPAPIPPERPTPPPVEPERVAEAWIVVICLVLVGILVVALLRGWL
jgi:hypothetical protein